VECNANLVSCTDYLIGRRAGIYLSSIFPPTYEKKHEKDMLNHLRAFKDGAIEKNG
jgi:hypothetical protein